MTSMKLFVNGNSAIALLVLLSVLGSARAQCGGFSSRKLAQTPEETIPEEAYNKCLFEILNSRDDLSKLRDAVMAAGLAGPFACSASELTLFAPTNEAFSALPEVPTGDDLVDVLKFHVLPAKVTSEQLQPGEQVVPTVLDGQSLKVEVSEEGMPNVQAMQGPEVDQVEEEENEATAEVTVTVAGLGNEVPAEVLETDLLACSSVIHVIDSVLLPSSA